MALPDFLKKENREPIDEVTEEFLNVLAKYEKQFDVEVMTEPSSRTMEEWIELLNICIEKNQTYLELTGEEIHADEIY